MMDKISPAAYSDNQRGLEFTSSNNSFADQSTPTTGAKRGAISFLGDGDNSRSGASQSKNHNYINNGLYDSPNLVDPSRLMSPNKKRRGMKMNGDQLLQNGICVQEMNPNDINKHPNRKQSFGGGLGGDHNSDDCLTSQTGKFNSSDRSGYRDFDNVFVGDLSASLYNNKPGRHTKTSKYESQHKPSSNNMIRSSKRQQEEMTFAHSYNKRMQNIKSNKNRGGGKAPMPDIHIRPEMWEMCRPEEIHLYYKMKLKEQQLIINQSRQFKGDDASCQHQVHHKRSNESDQSRHDSGYSSQLGRRQQKDVRIGLNKFSQQKRRPQLPARDKNKNASQYLMDHSRQHYSSNSPSPYESIEHSGQQTSHLFNPNLKRNAKQIERGKSRSSRKNNTSKKEAKMSYMDRINKTYVNAMKKQGRQTVDDTTPNSLSYSQKESSEHKDNEATPKSTITGGGTVQKKQSSRVLQKQKSNSKLMKNKRISEVAINSIGWEVESGKGNMLHQFEMETSKNYSDGQGGSGSSVVDQDSEPGSEDGYQNDNPCAENSRGTRLKQKQSAGKIIKRSIRQQQDCQSEYGQREKQKGLSERVDPDNLDEELENINAMNSISCNVTEYGARSKRQQDMRKHKELKRGDMLIMQANQESQLDGAEQLLQMPKRMGSEIGHIVQNNVPSPGEASLQANTEHNKKLHDSRKKPSKSKAFCNQNRLVIPSSTFFPTFSDKASNDSKKSQYRNLKINVKKANGSVTLGQLQNNSGGKSSTASQAAQPTSVIIPKSSQAAAQMMGNNVQQSLPTHQVPLQQQKSVKIGKQSMGSPMKIGQQNQNRTAQKNNNMTQAQANQFFIQATQAQRKQRDLQDLAVSPFHKSQVSYSDYKQYQNYFDKNNNNDGYWRQEQVGYYSKEYPATLDRKKTTIPITKWQLGKMIGSGSFGNVYEGIDQQQGRQIAVKQVPISKIGTNQGTQQKKIRALKQEIKLLNGLQHKNIVKYLGTHEDDEHLNVFLEYVAQGSLDHHYKNFKFTENLVASYTQQILLGLEYLHYNNIVHRDIKAANILIRDDGSCQLADFGSSKKIIETNNTETKSFCGTPYWMAPEVIKQSGHNRFADIWSLGCTVYEMTCKEPPWMDKNNQVFKVLNKIAQATKPPKYPKDISNALIDFLDCCFQNEPSKRANVYELLRHPFITRKEFIQPLAHQHSLQTINEQMSQFSDASPFTGSQRGFFNKKILQQQNSFNNQLQGGGLGTPSPNVQYHPDISPYSHMSSKTQGNNMPHQRQMNTTLYQFNEQFRNNQSMQDYENSINNNNNVVRNPSFNLSNSHSQVNSSKQESMSKIQKPPSQGSQVSGIHPVAGASPGVEESKLPTKTRLQTNTSSSSNAVSAQQQQFPYLQQALTEAQAEVVVVQQPPQRRLQQNGSNQEANDQSHQLTQAEQQQRPRGIVLGETGDSEHENDKGKRSLNVDSAGGNGRQYSFAEAQDQQNNAPGSARFSLNDGSESISAMTANNNPQENVPEESKQQQPQVDLLSNISSEFKRELESGLSNSHEMLINNQSQPKAEESGFSQQNSSKDESAAPELSDFGMSPIDKPHAVKRSDTHQNRVDKMLKKSQSVETEHRKSLDTIQAQRRTTVQIDINADQRSQISFGDPQNKQDINKKGSAALSDTESIKTSNFVKESPLLEAEQDSNMTKQGSPHLNVERKASFTSTTPTTKKEQKKQDKMRKFAEKFQMSRGEDSPETPKSSEASSNINPNHLSPVQDNKQRKVNPLVHISDANPGFGGLGGLLPQNCKNNTRELASQLNKLSLDNNLTDIEEDENEGNTARRLSNVNAGSPTAASAAAANKKQSETLQISAIDVSDVALNKSNEQQPQETPQPPESPPLLPQERKSSNIVEFIQSDVISKDDMDQQKQPKQQFLPIPERKHSQSLNTSNIQDNSGFNSLGSRRSDKDSSSKKSCDSGKKRKRVEDQIFQEIAKQQAQKKEKEKADVTKAKDPSPKDQRMVKARKLMIPKIFVSNSNKSPTKTSELDSQQKKGSNNNLEKQQSQSNSHSTQTPKTNSVGRSANSSQQPQNSSCQMEDMASLECTIRQILDIHGQLDETMVRFYTEKIIHELKLRRESQSGQAVHSVLKCENIIVSADGRIKLIESPIKESPNLKEIGSPNWLAPEILLGQGLSRASESWSLGCCVIEMLSGSPPWGKYGSDGLQILSMIQNTGTVNLDFPQDISEECNDFLKYCFMLDSSKRALVDELQSHPFVTKELNQEDVLNTSESLVCGLLNALTPGKESYSSLMSPQKQGPLAANVIYTRYSGQEEYKMSSSQKKDASNKGDFVDDDADDGREADNDREQTRKAENDVLKAIADQIDKKKSINEKGASSSQASQADKKAAFKQQPMSSIELLVQAVDKDSNCDEDNDGDQSSSDDSSSYKSPEIDSDELAAMGDNDLV